MAIIKTMKGQGLPSVDARTEQTIRFAGFLIPVVLFLYGLFVQLGIVQSEQSVVPFIFYGVSAAWIGLSIYQFMMPPRSYTDIIVRLFAYHILAALYILYVSGIVMPFIIAWIILAIVSYLYAGRSGLIADIAILLTTSVGVVLLHVHDSALITHSMLYLLGIAIVGLVIGMIYANQEVDRKELIRSQADEMLQRDRIMTIVNNLADAVISTDSDGIIQVYNAACLNLLDTNSELRGKLIDHILPLSGGDNQPFNLVHNLRTAHSVQSREDLSATISGETIRLSVTYSPIRSANSIGDSQIGRDGYVIILRDITKQKSLEEERDEFISVVSHELRTPITIVEGSLSNVQLMMSRPDIPKSTLVESVNVSHDQILFLAKMVNDLSTLSRAERGVADTPEEIDVSELIHDVYTEYAPQAEAKGLRFNLDVSPQLGSVLASRLYLKELLQNFVTNAIKYTKVGDITVSVKRVRNTLTFSVKDTGIGISKSDQQHIFDKFWRSEDYRTRETGGTGLGLYVSRKLSKKLNTQISMTSRLNHGSTFSFTIPVKAAK